MNAKVFIGVLIIVALGLGVGLYVRHEDAVRQHDADRTSILRLSNDVIQVSAQLATERSRNRELDTNLALRSAELLSLSNSTERVRAALADTEARLSETKVEAAAAAAAAAAELAKRDARISELEGRNDDMTKQMAVLKASLTSLETQISDTERKLATSEGDRDFLLAELRRLQTEKAELEQQFNDLAVVREQVRKLRDELSLSRRLDWSRRGLSGADSMKGAERLMRGFQAPPPDANRDLDVEIRQDGTILIAPGNTNAPPQ